MADQNLKPDPAAQSPAILHEADIGSGERTPAQHDTDRMIREIPRRGEGSRQDADTAGNRQGDKQDSSKD
ncbi:hypothetical protein [uncultured Massilia sp.]|uniref:hypothetical protein n=1 Tax=uncultured Massilia sp. TaxID=169973 RepID=UPI0025F6FE29|nr:hypothetical protein [uncultured Massilia sp.]